MLLKQKLEDPWEKIANQPILFSELQAINVLKPQYRMDSTQGTTLKLSSGLHTNIVMQLPRLDHTHIPTYIHTKQLYIY